MRTDLSLELHLHEISYLIYGFIYVHFLMSDGALFVTTFFKKRCYLVTMRKWGTKENFSKSIAWDVHHLKNLPIPSTWTRSFLRCFRSQSLLNAAKVKALVPAKSHNPLLWRTLFPPVWRVQSELFSLKLYFLQQSSKWPLKETGGRRILHHGANTVMLYFTSTFRLSYLT